MIEDRRFLNNWDHVTNGELFLWRHLKASVRVMIDVGCREDDYYFCDSDTDTDTRFHLFEPHPVFHAAVAAKAARFPPSVVRVNNVALGAVEGTLPYYDLSQSFVRRPMCGDDAPTRHLPVRTLRGYLREHALTTVDFLKIDTEGFEIDVLRGLGDALPCVKHIQFEYGGTYPDREVLLRDVYDLIAVEGRGAYSIYIVCPDGLRARPVAIEHAQYSNYVASRAPEELPQGAMLAP